MRSLSIAAISARQTEHLLPLDRTRSLAQRRQSWWPQSRETTGIERRTPSTTTVRRPSVGRAPVAPSSSARRPPRRRCRRPLRPSPSSPPAPPPCCRRRRGAQSRQGIRERGSETYGSQPPSSPCTCRGRDGTRKEHFFCCFSLPSFVYPWHRRELFIFFFLKNPKFF